MQNILDLLNKATDKIKEDAMEVIANINQTLSGTAEFTIERAKNAAIAAFSGALENHRYRYIPFHHSIVSIRLFIGAYPHCSQPLRSRRQGYNKHDPDCRLSTSMHILWLDSNVIQSARESTYKMVSKLWAAKKRQNKVSVSLDDANTPPVANT
ncbi:hypothetical protein I4U23_005271 [Adineta vaga]|nr:hypothetical protein I4U23_005271 [Adineta vaga]